MICLERITIREIHLALREPFASAGGVVRHRRIALLRLHDRSGATAWSECVAPERPTYTAETIDTAWLAIRDWLAPLLLGRAVDGPDVVGALLDASVRGHNMAKAALEMGCWALAAELRGVSLATLIGGTRDSVPTGIALGLVDDPALLAERARAAVAEGYGRIKVKIEPGRDVAPLRLLRETLGPSIGLMADANATYRLDDAEHLAALDSLGLLMIEQPLAADDLVGHAALAARIATPICLDESIDSVTRAEHAVRLGSARVLNVKPGRLGGFVAARAVHDVCVAAHIPVWCGGMLETGIGRAYNVALASLPGFTLPGDLSPSARYWTCDVVDPAWTMDAAGMVRVPRARAGLGVVVDERFIDDLTVRTETLLAPSAAVVPAVARPHNAKSLE